MSPKPEPKAFYKQPAVIVITLFILGLFIVRHFSSQLISDEPVVLTKADPPVIIMYSTHMYSTQSCMYCYVAKQFFKKHNLPYTEYDIEASEKNMKTFRILGGRGTPLLIINGEIIYGYDERLMRQAL